jgi:D-alanyl-D-alanine carboxypeptidase
MHHTRLHNAAAPGSIIPRLVSAALAAALICGGCTPMKPQSAGELHRPLLHFLMRPSCQTPTLGRALARLNSASLYVLHIAPFGREETGWATYAPEIEHEIHTRCGADSAGFADALAAWQRRRGLTPTGVMTVATFEVMRDDWQARRPFVRLRASGGACPPPPPARELADATPLEGYRGKPVQLRKGALAAYRRMVAAARQGEPAMAAKPELLTLFSAYRSPAYDAARCAHDHNCQGIVRAACSAHRTGLAFDIVLNTAPGYPVDSSADMNRRAMVNGLAYRWLVANAGAYGFVNYPFEPWHWEWTGEKP